MTSSPLRFLRLARYETILVIASLAMLAGVGLTRTGQPTYGHLELAPGVPADGHMMQLPQRNDIVLGCYTTRYPDGLPNEAVACYWRWSTGRRYDLTGTIEVDGVAYTPRLPEPGVGGRGETTWRGYSADGERAVVTYTVPGVLSADFNGDGVVNTMDVTAFLNAYAEQREGE